LACDPHLQKSILSLWYITRVSWNETDSITGESYRTFLTGGTLVGTPAFTHARSPLGAMGVTALNPDVTDLFVEYLRAD